MLMLSYVLDHSCQLIEDTMIDAVTGFELGHR